MVGRFMREWWYVMALVAAVTAVLLVERLTGISGWLLVIPTGLALGLITKLVRRRRQAAQTRA